MSYLKIALVVCACVAITAAQYEQFGLDFSGGFLPTNFGSPSLNMLSAAQRDPRANRGPVVFPPSPPGDPSQTSGVVAGASGYGFVPPGSQGIHGTAPSPPTASSSIAGLTQSVSKIHPVKHVMDNESSSAVPGKKQPALP